MSLSSRSTEWLINRAQYLKDKAKALEIIIDMIREMQIKNRENIAFVEASEADMRALQAQKEYILASLSMIEKEISKREVKTKK